MGIRTGFRLKILHINDKYCHLGGSEKYLLDTCNAQEEAGHQVVIISSSESESITVPGRKEYFLKSSYGLRSSLKIWSKFKEIIKTENPDVINLHNTHYFVSPLITKKLCLLKPTVKFVHDAKFFCPHLGRKIIPFTGELCHYPVGIHCFNRKGCYPFHVNGGGVFHNLHKFLFVSYELSVSKVLEKIIVGSEYMHDELVRNGFAPKKIRIIPCYTDKVFDIRGFQPEKRLILCIGRFDGVKGIPQFIESLNFLKEQEWRAEIVGDGPFRWEVEEKIKHFGLGSRIKLLGRLPNDQTDWCYQRCRMVVMPSMIPESFGLVGIEAMAFSKPVIAFDSGGIRNWLVDGETGFLVERGNIKGLANRISQLLKDEWLARKMGEMGKARVEKFYRKEQHLKRLCVTYEEVINNWVCHQKRINKDFL